MESINSMVISFSLLKVGLSNNCARREECKKIKKQVITIFIELFIV
jgi:hypothetical protein